MSLSRADNNKKIIIKNLLMRGFLHFDKQKNPMLSDNVNYGSKEFIQKVVEGSNPVTNLYFKIHRLAREHARNGIFDHNLDFIDEVVSNHEKRELWKAYFRQLFAFYSQAKSIKLPGSIKTKEADDIHAMLASSLDSTFWKIENNILIYKPLETTSSQTLFETHEILKTLKRKRVSTTLVRHKSADINSVADDVLKGARSHSSKKPCLESGSDTKNISDDKMLSQEDYEFEHTHTARTLAILNANNVSKLEKLKELSKKGSDSVELAMQAFQEARIISESVAKQNELIYSLCSENHNLHLKFFEKLKLTAFKQASTKENSTNTEQTILVENSTNTASCITKDNFTNTASCITKDNSTSTEQAIMVADKSTSNKDVQTDPYHSYDCFTFSEASQHSYNRVELISPPYKELNKSEEVSRYSNRK